MTALVLRTLAAGGKPGNRLATIIQRLALVICDRETGEFEEYCYLGDDEVLKKGRTFPRAWWPRLDKAIETGALEFLSVDRIVEIMLAGPR